MARALVRAHGLGDLAAGSAPAGLTVALAVDAHPVGGAAGVDAVHCRHREQRVSASDRGRRSKSQSFPHEGSKGVEMTRRCVSGSGD